MSLFAFLLHYCLINDLLSLHRLALCFWCQEEKDMINEY